MKRKKSMVEPTRIGCLLAGVLIAAAASLPASVWGQDGDAEHNFVVQSKPQGALVKLEGEYEVSGRTPFTVTFPLMGRYEIEAVKAGYEKWASEVFLTGNSESNLTISLNRLSRIKAGLRSLFIPGWGQYYSDRKAHAFFFATAAVASGALATFAQLDFKSEVDEFNRLSENLGRESVTLEDLHRQYDKVEDADDFRKKTFIVLGSVWFYNFIDALIFFPSHRGQVDITSNKKFQISQSVTDESVTVGVDVKF